MHSYTDDNRFDLITCTKTKISLPYLSQLKLLLIFTSVIFISLPQGVYAQKQTQTDQWRSPTSLDGLYQQIAQDLQADKPLIISAYYGMWHVRANQPERNLNWGGKYGHSTLLMRAKRHPHIRRLYKYRQWDLIHKESSKTDPLRTLVFHQKVKPAQRWRQDGVTKPISVFLVMQAFQGQEKSAIEMVSALRTSKGRVIQIKDYPSINLGDAQVSGYFGHNFFYDYDDFQWDGFKGIRGQPQGSKGVFAIGCNTARVPGFHQLIDQNIYAVLFSRSLMASEGYSTLALADGILRHLNSKEFVKFADRTYQYFQKLERPNRRVGRPFVSHEFLMYPQASKLE